MIWPVRGQVSCCWVGRLRGSNQACEVLDGQGGSRAGRRVNAASPRQCMYNDIGSCGCQLLLRWRSAPKVFKIRQATVPTH
jgi:hypothetical protein